MNTSSTCSTKFLLFYEMIKHIAFFKKFILFIIHLCKNIMKIYETNVNGFYKKLFLLNVPTCSYFSCLTQIKKVTLQIQTNVALLCRNYSNNYINLFFEINYIKKECIVLRSKLIILLSSFFLYKCKKVA